MERHKERVNDKWGQRTDGAQEDYCPICGKEVSDHTLKRFGEYFCSEAHVTEYAREVREKADNAPVQAVHDGQKESEAGPQKGGFRNLLKLGACCAAPILALAILLPLVRGGATGLGAIAGNVLYFAALLACALGMYFMMRSMGRMQQGEKEEGHDKPGDPKALPPDGKGKTG